MSRTRFAKPLLAILLFSVAILPHMAFAASGSFFGPIMPQECKCEDQIVEGADPVDTAPDYGCILQLVQNVVNAAVTFGVLLCVFWFAYSGFRLMISRGNAEALSEGKTRLMNAVFGIIVILCAWILVDFVMKTVYEPSTALEGGTFGPWNDVLSGNGHDFCIVGKVPLGITTGDVSILLGNGTVAGGGAGGDGTLTSGGAGACNAQEVQQKGTAAGVAIKSGQASFLACVAKPESRCGAQMQNYNWNKGSSAYGPFQILLGDNARYFETKACYTAAGVSGPLNCASGFSKGNPIASKAATVDACKKAAANLGCSTAAAVAILNTGSTPYKAWTGNSDSTKKHQECIPLLNK